MKKRYVVAGILAAAGLICGGIAYYQYYQDAHAGQEYEKIKEKVVTEEPKKPEETQKSTVEIPIDFQTLQNMNPDIYAWIKVPGTVIDYPIVQSGTDNSYYLNHSVEHDENKAGAIFTEDYNTKTFEDPNTVIYGHGMANGSMFDGLHIWTGISLIRTKKSSSTCRTRFCITRFLQHTCMTTGICYKALTLITKTFTRLTWIWYSVSGI